MAESTQSAGPPIVVNVRKKRNKKKKREFSRGLQSIQETEVGLTRAANRLADAVADGLREYRRSRDRSSKRKSDGIVVDYVPNVARGLSETIRVASLIPYDLAQAVNHREFRGGVRYVTQLLTGIKFRDP
jgi:hypothetical protein